MNFRTLLGLSCAAAISFALVASASAEDKTVKIGVIFPLTGNAASAGIHAKAGLEVAMDIINNAHPELGNFPLAKNAGLAGLGGAKVELVFADNQGSPATGQNQALRLITGKILSVSRDTRYTVRTPTATIGIRGTGIYAEADAEQTYFCTCYGSTEVSASRDAASKETVVSKHHDKPLYILGSEPQGKNIRSAPFINHTDQELMLIEALVGRTPPFVFPDKNYAAPRRRY